MTDMTYIADGQPLTDTLTDPVNFTLQIYTDAALSYSELLYVDTSTKSAFDVREIELDVPGADEPKIRFKWRPGITEMISIANSNPKPIITPNTNGYTEYMIKRPSDNEASFDYSFEGGGPGFRLKVKVKRK